MGGCVVGKERSSLFFIKAKRNYKIILITLLRPQIAEKVGCPTDQTMFSCLKMTDPAELTIAGNIDVGGDPTGKCP